MATQRDFLAFIDRRGAQPAPVIARALGCSTQEIHSIADRLAVGLPAAPRGNSARLRAIEDKIEDLARQLEALKAERRGRR